MRWPRCVTLAVVLLAATSAEAQVGVRVHEVAERGVRIDGSLRDWRRVRFIPVGRGHDASMEFALGYDRAGLYVAASVLDDRMVRTSRPGSREDAIVLTLAIPTEGGALRGTELWLYAGVPGRSSASVSIAPLGRPPRVLTAARAVEGPRRRGQGYVLEVFVPWGAIPGAGAWQSGRAALRLRDVDSESRPQVESEPATVVVEPGELDRLPLMLATGGEGAMLTTFSRSRGLTGVRPRHDLRADVVGDARHERVILLDRYVLVMGEGYRGGESFDFFELPVTAAADARSPRLVDVTGDGKRELVITLRQRNEQGARDLWQVYSFAGEQVRAIFGVEVRKQTPEGHVEARLRLRRARRGPRLIELGIGDAEGLSAEQYREAPATGVEGILLPWGPVASRVWQWDGQRFSLVRERENPDYEPPAPTPPVGARRPQRAEPPPPPPGVDDLVAAFRQRAGIPSNVRPRFRTTANLAADRRREQAMVFGHALLVVGPGFRGGNGWFHFDLPVSSDADVLSLRTADLTGDGRAEIILRIRRQVGDVQRELLLVHQFTPRGFPRLLAVEIARQQEGNRIENDVRFLRRGARRILQVRPGRARGWSAQTWPFADGTGDGVAPLLLPWRDAPMVYRYENGALTGS